MNKDSRSKKSPFSRRWQASRLSVEEAEDLIRENELGWGPVENGPLNDEWKAFLAKMAEGDELWKFSSPEETWAHLVGRAGTALVRKRKIIEQFIIMTN